MPTVLSIALSLFGIFLTCLLVRLRRVARDANVKSVWSRPRNNHLFNLSRDSCSKLSGQFYFFSPFSTLGYFGARMFGEIPYILQGRSWALSRNHKGTAAWQTIQGELSEMHSYTRLCHGRTGRLCPGNFHSRFFGRMQTQTSKLVDFNISDAIVHHTNCRHYRYQSTSTVCLSTWMPSTLVCRKSRPIVPSFPSPYIDTRYWLFLEETLWHR